MAGTSPRKARRRRVKPALRLSPSSEPKGAAPGSNPRKPSETRVFDAVGAPPRHACHRVATNVGPLEGLAEMGAAPTIQSAEKIAIDNVFLWSWPFDDSRPFCQW